MALTDLQKIRVEVQDIDPSLPFLPDETYEYLLAKNNNSVRRASLDAARLILYQLSMRSTEVKRLTYFQLLVDIKQPNNTA